MRNGKSVHLAALSAYGDVRFVTKGYIYPDMVDDEGRLPIDLNDKINNAVGEFDPNFDFFLPIGDFALVSLIAARLAKRYPKYQILRYDRQENGHYILTID